MPSDRSQQPSLRTDEERERDRAERARRRAARAPTDREMDPQTGQSPPQPNTPTIQSPPTLPLPPPALAETVEPPASVVSSPATPIPAAAPPGVSVPDTTSAPVVSPAVPPPVAPPPVASPPATPSQPRPSRRHVRSPFARILALFALALVVGAVWLVVARLTNTHPSKPVALPVVVRVLIPEGETRRQIAARAHAAGLLGSYLTASKRSGLLNPVHYGAPSDTPNLEGFLFPATYDLYRGDRSSRLVHEQLIAFTENFGDEDVRRARELHVTPYQLLIVASMVEREAQIPGDRSKVAAVIYNRLRLNMALGIDATIRYALDDYTRPLTAAQLALDSPYNTRTHRGLPPTPISDPGLASIHAAAHPAHVAYLYYVAGADGCGEQVFSTSFAQFERDAAAYREALRANGGHVPVCRKKQ